MGSCLVRSFLIQQNPLCREARDLQLMFGPSVDRLLEAYKLVEESGQ